MARQRDGVAMILLRNMVISACRNLGPSELGLFLVISARDPGLVGGNLRLISSDLQIRVFMPLLRNVTIHDANYTSANSA